jgi:PAS domain-containing protein
MSADAGAAAHVVEHAEVGVMSPTSTVEVALLDRAGRIVSVNAAWECFCVENHGDPTRCGVGASYLGVCDADDDPVAHQVADSVRAALRGELPAPLAVEVPCHAPGTWRWFDLLVSSRLADDGGCVGATVTLSLARTATPPSGARGRHRIGGATVGTEHLPELPGPSGRDRLGDGFAQAVMTIAPCALVLGDDGGSVIVANPQADALFGVRPGGLLGRPLDALFPVVGDGVSAGVPDPGAPWRDAPFSSREAVGVPPGGRPVRIRMSSGPVPLWLGTGVLVAAVGVDEAPGAGPEPSADVDDLLSRLDAVVRRTFSAGLTLAGLPERLGDDEVAAGAVADAIRELDGAVAEARRAASAARSPTRQGPPGPSRGGRT